MSKQLSFTALENTFRHELRGKLEQCEDTFDMEQQFALVIAEFLRQALGERMDIVPEDVRLAPDGPPYYVLSPRLLEAPEFLETFDNSDLPNILERFAEKTRKDHVHLHRKDAQSEQKIRNPQRG